MKDEGLVRKVEETLIATSECGCGCGQAGCSCDEVAEHLFELLDAQMPEEQAERLKHHIATCPHCTQMAEAESHVRDIVRRSCCESAPSTLRVRITHQLAVYRQVTEDGERS
ncbi:MAG: mycothiol system anti-sigma-R factor [Ancrocorticia sp.]|jgi:mycothiol system anti-sigma-R factor|nr:mycothiol system anti-sigma-R factor [Ancrocorticia sp.]MCI1895543.1 mycothiol system anti-sigma-R factor [Ancrocorticia sp.]MCI1932352.1 mycothiol system anti-sigma-R factor [Ancrocorticia sp.]MCI1962813.1 mycothiol system anti-sigma-R factor [Ancrocorticia sp.]MCI2001907.1 mycothiol system anti-sigma-R factor [Ancrocorticia sp.]